jgi:hypothetical protein
VELLDLKPQRVGDLVFARHAPETLLDLAVGPFEAAALLAHAARHPVERAKLVENGALDSELRVGLELAVLVRIVLLDGIHQADDARVVQVIEIDVRGETDGNAVDDVTDEGSVLEHDLLFERRRNVCALLLGLAKQSFHALSLPLVPRGSWFISRSAAIHPRLRPDCGEKKHAACQPSSFRARRGRNTSQ